MSLAAKLARLFVASALLAAQQSALAHQIWHYATAPAAHVAADSQKTDAGGKSLCDQHTALGTILGALGSADACPMVAPQQADAISGAVQSTAHRALLSPSSRDPPSLR